ncbi:MAG: signal peptide peptidase SppA [Thermodesulfovibrionia bacterium]|nr:signal peptide peptidase SppA [Thermodesulfovibrionia bacterium]
MKKILLFLFITIIVIAVISYVLTLTHIPIGEKVGIIRVEGVILDSRDVIDELKTYAKDSSIKAVVIRIDSPGGAVAPAQEIYKEIVKLKKEKKVVASMGSVAASGGYYIACPADKIVANPGTLTGSIGVIMEIPNIEGLMKKIGVETKVIKSGKHKDIASMFKSMTEEERKILQSVLDDVHDQFIRAVSEGRNMKYENIKELADGRIFTGKKAKELGLVDTLGNLDDAVNLAGKLSGIKGEPRVVSKKEKLSIWNIISGNLPSELIKKGFPTIGLKYILTL